mmetsp:Transcript_22229/g.26696  ORF Transcript_22229/g.26696 Transcript_22229/m.26696 type:complete len:342 (+) Transcript_22229:148-1173(+)|eukprot:CAMPEP_0197847990 /NCGR_PEP_ID=MMETSP1438-20131217/7707_1 /TAXON_ID=1461541 /ORGANISM="Pterosperma sp., Strain CCMP1384" /LENGTH=341 /DNA_ID=CAMNT_0043460091 /DNA_START=148 /DNA_END=1173 /DNA_ORIENTATION=+
MATVDLNNLKSLFMQQKEFLDCFFNNLLYSQVEDLAQKILDCKGSILFTGVGKSGFIAKKVNQTLVSTGTKALWLAPVDALHGDIGLVSEGDILIMLTKSGSTPELLTLLPYAKAKGAFVVSLTSRQESPLAQQADMHVCLPLEKELSPFSARESREAPPVTSNTIQMLFGDTLAVALMKKRGLTQPEYAMNHPAGRIGKRLVLRVSDVMKSGNVLPLATPGQNGLSALVQLAGSSKGCGCLLVVDDSQRLLGTLSDGDLRRALTKYGEEALVMCVMELMNFEKSYPMTATSDMMAADALILMEGGNDKGRMITYMPVLAAGGGKKLEGILTLHDLTAAGL